MKHQKPMQQPTVNPLAVVQVIHPHLVQVTVVPAIRVIAKQVRL